MRCWRGVLGFRDRCASPLVLAPNREGENAFSTPARGEVIGKVPRCPASPPFAGGCLHANAVEHTNTGDHKGSPLRSLSYLSGGAVGATLVVARAWQSDAVRYAHYGRGRSLHLPDRGKAAIGRGMPQ